MKRSRVRQFLGEHLGHSALARKADAVLEIALAIPPTDYVQIRKLKRIRLVFPYSMCGYKRLANVYDLATTVELERLPGALVECGVWKGGCIGLMASVARDFGSRRKIVLFDSFEGLPEPTDVDGEEARRYAGGRVQGKMETIGRCIGPLDTVKELLFGQLGIDQATVEFHQGWFKDTVPVAGPAVGPIAILRLDGDWYESTLVCLEGLYDQVVPGGFVIIDDYRFWDGCRRAVDEFLAHRGVDVRLRHIDFAGSYFRKP
jgi:O-methyltransferase